MPHKDRLQEPKPSFVSNLKASAQGLSKGLLGGTSAGLEGVASSPLAASATKTQTYSNGHRNYRLCSEKLALLPKRTHIRNHAHEGFRSKSPKGFEGDAIQKSEDETNLQFDFQAFLQGNQNITPATPIEHFDLPGNSKTRPIIDRKGEPVIPTWESTPTDTALSGSSSGRNNYDQHHSARDGHFSLEDGSEVRMLLPDTNLNTDLTPMDRNYSKSPETAMEQLPAPDEQGFVDTSHAELPKPSYQRGICTEGLSNTSAYGANADELLSDWKHVLDCYTNGIWGDLLPAMNAAKTEVNASGISQQKTGCLKMSASRRLDLLCGHIARGTVQNSPRHVWPIEDHSKPDSRGQNQPKYVNYTNTHRSNNQTQTSQKDEEEMPVAPFHCPWISCHHRFRNSSEMLVHTDAHSNVSYECAHTECGALFDERKRWAEHLQEAHHNLIGINS
ncbi:MAG: hypothetical protein Q9157_005823 [Trypethelium eluteriae]